MSDTGKANCEAKQMDKRKREVILHSYDPCWKTEFEEEKNVLLEMLGEKHLYPEILHIGCTSIEDTVAKAIIDMLILLPTDEEVRAAVNVMIQVGYTFLGDGGRVGRYFFSNDESIFPYYLHVTTRENQVAKDQLTFQKILQSNKEIMWNYMALKEIAAEQFPYDRFKYRTAKGHFIEGVLRAYEYGLSLGGKSDLNETSRTEADNTTENGQENNQ